MSIVGEDSELVYQAISYDNADLLRDLLEANADGKLAAQPVASDGSVALHVAAARGQVACVRVLLADAHCDIDAVTSLQNASKTPLLLASEHGHAEVVQILIDAGADLFYCDANGHSALQIAQMGGHDGVASVLIAALERIHETSHNLRAELCAACIDGDENAVLRILSEMPKASCQQICNGTSTDEKSVLYLACENGRAAVVKALLSVPGHIIIFSSTGDNVLHAAVASQDAATVEVCLRKFPFLMDAANNEGSLPLHWACRCGHLDTVKLMLEYEYPDDECKFFEDTRGVQTYRFICDLNATDNECRTPLYLAVANGHVALVHFLLNFTTELFRVGEEPSIGSPLALNIYCSNGRTALMIACANGAEDVVRILLDHDVDVNLPIALTESEICELQPAEARCAGSGALVEAAKAGNLRLVKLLLRHGALDYDNRALAVAVASGSPDAVSQFLNQLAFTDAEYRINKRSPLDSGLGASNTNLLANLLPTTAVQCNWHGATLETLATEWLTAAALKFNQRLRHSRMALAAITRLDLSHNRLAEVPMIVFSLQSLHVLDLSNNVLQKFDVPSTADFSVPCLETLSLECNFLTALPGVLFSRSFPSLKTLNVAGNRLRLVPPVVWSAPRLKDLNLSNNEILEVCTVSMPVTSARGGRKSAKASHQERIMARAARTRDRPALSRAGASPRSVPTPRASTVTDLDVTRLNAWQKRVQLSNIDDLDEDEPVSLDSGGAATPDVFTSALRTLNLSANRLSSVPSCLACCCPKLTRLDLSQNSIVALGSVECLPGALRHLNLAYNRLSRGFARPEAPDLVCLAPTTTTGPDAVRGRATPTGNRHSRSRSRSVARNQRSLSVVRAGDAAEATASELCPHKAHARFEALKTLNLSHNQLSQLDLFVAFASRNDFATVDQFSLKEAQAMRQYLVFPALTNLDISYNALKHVPPTVSLLSYLAALNVAGNAELETLPYELGLLDKLWNISLKGCPMKDPIKAIVSGDNYKTVDLIAFLRNKLENSKSYNKLKLVVLGGPSVGKTLLLQQMRSEGNVSRKNLTSESWSRRMGHSPSRNSSRALNNAKSPAVVTSCVDVAEWSYEPKKTSKGAPPVDSIGPLTFRTWDFDGKMKEFAAVCQYFLSRRSIYLVLWKATDGEIALTEIQEWLLLIQTRAPNATVIIVGTHYDAVEDNLSRFPDGYVESLYQAIHQKFVNLPDSDKKGLPRVAASLFVSLKSRHNVRSLCNVVYQAAAELRTFGRKAKLLMQKVPSIYLALEKVAVAITDDLRSRGAEPVFRFVDFYALASATIAEEYGRPFRNETEFRQACAFLHDNGVIVHFDDTALSAFVFLDPPWLCSALASAVSSASSGSASAHDHALTSVTEMTSVIKSFITHATTAESSRNSLLKACMFRLLSRFEAALPCQNKLLLVPSALPDEYLLRADYPGTRIRLRTKGCIFECHWKPPSMTVSLSPTRKSLFHRKIVRSLAHRHFGVGKAGDKESPPQSPRRYSNSSGGGMPLSKKVYVVPNPKANLRRLYVMQYVPPGFWARMITRILDDDKVAQVISKLFLITSPGNTPLTTPRSGRQEPQQDSGVADPALNEVLNKDGFEWILWRSGLEVDAFGTTLLSLKQFLPLAHVRDVNYSMTELRRKCDDSIWRPFVFEQATLVELVVPAISARVILSDGREYLLEQDPTAAARLLAVIVAIIDDLLEDWFPALGTRFVHTSEGRLLVDRLIPCPECANNSLSSLRGQHSFDGNDEPVSTPSGPPRSQTMEGFVVVSKSCIHLFAVEECILQARGFPDTTDSTGYVECPRHEKVAVSSLAPDVSFADLLADLAISDTFIRRGKLMGRGAFGFVFDGYIKSRKTEGTYNEVALKILEPVDPGIGAKGSAQAAFEAFMLRWRNDAQEHCARSYITARQELNMLADLSHPHVTSLLGFCPKPMTIAVELAPLGSLDRLLANYRRCDSRLSVPTLQAVCLQIAKALEYLHSSRIIYRDLKSENVLVWRFPLPRSHGDVVVKLGDYGISRHSYPSGVCKGYGGTEGFMAPEIMCTNGEAEYNEKVDCFSYGMFVYELISLKQPYDGQEQMKDFILDGGRPFLSDKELLVPSNVLDLMVVAWAEAADDRPTASQLVAMASAPEFGHVLDVAALDHGVIQNATALVALPPEALGVNTTTNNANCWLHSGPGTFHVLGSGPYGWLDHRRLDMDAIAVTAVAAIDENTVWLGDGNGVVRVYSNSALEELSRWSISDLDPAFSKGGSSAAIRGLDVFTERQTGLITLLHSVLIVAVSGAERPTFVTSIELAERICITAVARSLSNWQIWTGHDDGKIIVHHINGTKTSLIYSASVSHGTPTRLRSTDLRASPDTGSNTPVKFISTSPICGSTLAWSVLEGGSFIYLWDNAVLKKTLDTRKLLPVSESLSSMNLDSVKHASISAITVLSIPAEQLIIGTTAGLVVVMNGRCLTPLSSFQPFAGPVDCVLSVACQSFAIPLGQREPSMQSLNSVISSPSPVPGSKPDAQPQPQGISQSIDSGVINDYLLDAVSKVKSMLATGSSDKHADESDASSEAYFVAVGHAYRSLLDRFSPKTESICEVAGQRTAIVFRASDWE
uniref:Non-specific serine/threonine protein kinase n=1 Tax=Panagrellus redivivus TaxID=6233 RepID=A0A7E4VDA0_PANRE